MFDSPILAAPMKCIRIKSIRKQIIVRLWRDWFDYNWEAFFLLKFGTPFRFNIHWMLKNNVFLACAFVTVGIDSHRSMQFWTIVCNNSRKLDSHSTFFNIHCWFWFYTHQIMDFFGEIRGEKLNKKNVVEHLSIWRIHIWMEYVMFDALKLNVRQDLNRLGSLHG